MKSQAKEVRITKKWIEEFVITQGLCPFASAGYASDLIHYKYSAGLDLKTHLLEFWIIVEKMLNNDDDYISNSFLVLDDQLTFDGVMRLSSICQEFLDEADLSDLFQLVEFHPELMFGDHGKGDPAHYINRSPFPMIHILRVDEVEDAIAAHPDISQVPLINIDTMRDMGCEKLKRNLESYRNMP